MKIKVLAGYFFLIMIASVAVWIIYTEVLRLSDNRDDISTLNKKILNINGILSNLYEAEVLERSYSQTGDQAYYEKYRNLIDSIYTRIDTLALLAENPNQQIHTDSIRYLLEMKRKNLEELAHINRSGSSRDLFNRAMARITYNSDSIEYYQNVYKTLTTNRDSVFVKNKNRKFFERLADVFSQKTPDSTYHVNVTQSVQIDSVISRFNPADSVAQFIKEVMEDVRQESLAVERKLAKKEQELLATDQNLTLQLRRILSVIENEEFKNSYIELELLHEQVGNTVWLIVLLGSSALLVIIFFLVLILRDISKSQKYRRELESAKAYAESLLKSKEQFMLSITHDLKTPLGSIIGYARLMKEADSAEKKDFYLHNINMASEHVMKLIYDLVDFTRLETGKLKIEHVRFNLKTLIDEIISGFYPMAASKNLTLELNNLVSKADYRSDPVRMRQILGNLISNAIKFTHEGKVCLNVHIVKSGGSSDLVKFEVSDTGIGMSETDMKIVFDEFSRVASAGDKQYEGAGLGLTISKRLVTLLKGQLTVESEPGKGSKFTVLLPLERSMGTLQPQKKNKVSLASAYTGLSVLLIDDDEIMLGMTAEVLEKAEMKVTRCNHPEEAIKILDSENFDIILTDISMPSITGIELLQHIRKSAHGKTPVIAITGQDRTMRDQLLNSGFSASIDKPFFPEQLLDTIGDIVVNGKTAKGSLIRHQTTAEHNPKMLYSLRQIEKFAVNDPESIRHILISFIETTQRDLLSFQKYIDENNTEELSGLAHKMLAMFRQLEAFHIVEPLAFLENSAKKVISKEEMEQTGNQVLQKISHLIRTIEKDQKITANT